jgi:hypothetical protein
MLLSREDAEVVLEEDYTTEFENVLAPDECYFATVLAHRGRNPREAVVNRGIMWTRWKEWLHPKEFLSVSPRIVANLRESGHYFARKFPAGSNIGDYGLHRGK